MQDSEYYPRKTSIKSKKTFKRKTQTKHKQSLNRKTKKMQIKIPKEITIFISGHGQVKETEIFTNVKTRAMQKLEPLNNYGKEILYYNPMPVTGCIIYDYERLYSILNLISNRKDYINSYKKNWNKFIAHITLQMYCKESNYLNFLKKESKRVFENPQYTEFRDLYNVLRNDKVIKKLKCKFRKITKNKMYYFKENEFPVTGMYLFNSTIPYPAEIKDLIEKEYKNIDIKDGKEIVINKKTTMHKLILYDSVEPLYKKNGYPLLNEQGEQVYEEIVSLQSIIDLLSKHYDRIIIYDFTCNALETEPSHFTDKESPYVISLEGSEFMTPESDMMSRASSSDFLKSKTSVSPNVIYDKNGNIIIDISESDKKNIFLNYWKDHKADWENEF